MFDVGGEHSLLCKGMNIVSECLRIWCLGRLLIPEIEEVTRGLRKCIMCSFIIVLFTMYEGESKSKVRLSVQALQSMPCETSGSLSKYILGIVATSDCQV
jgi:hypothetical protein